MMLETPEAVLWLAIWGATGWIACIVIVLLHWDGRR